MEIAGYEDLVEIGRGGFATVYRARQVAFSRIVAVKVLVERLRDEESIRRFDRERRAVGSLSWHPRIVPIYDAGTTDSGEPFIAMEYLPNGSLGGRWLDGGPVDAATALSAGVQLADALEAAHRAGTLHRDVKPENVLIGNFGDYKLADFGVAAVTTAVSTAAGTFVGTISYLAPEVLHGERATAKADVYAAGSTLFTLLTGAPAFSRSSDDSPMAAILRATQGPVPDLRQEGVPDALACAIEEAMVKDPADRIPSAEAFARELQDVQRALGQPVTETFFDRDPTAASAVGPSAAQRPTSLRGASVPFEDATIRSGSPAAVFPSSASGSSAGTSTEVVPRKGCTEPVPAPDGLETTVAKRSPGTEPVNDDGSSEGGRDDLGTRGPPRSERRRTRIRRRLVAVLLDLVLLGAVCFVVASVSIDNDVVDGGLITVGSGSMTFGYDDFVDPEQSLSLAEGGIREKYRVINRGSTDVELVVRSSDPGEPEIDFGVAPAHSSRWVRAPDLRADTTGVYRLVSVPGPASIPITTGPGYNTDVDWRLIGLSAVVVGALLLLIGWPMWICIGLYVLVFGPSALLMPLSAALIEIGARAAFEASPGEMAGGLRLVRVDDGNRPGFWRCCLRALARPLSVLPLGAGYWVPPMTSNPRPWHDRIAGTRTVTRKHAAASTREGEPDAS